MSGDFYEGMRGLASDVDALHAEIERLRQALTVAAQYVGTMDTDHARLVVAALEGSE